MKKLQKFTFSRLGQFLFTFREVATLVYKTKPRFLIAVFTINIFSGLLVTPTLYLQKLIIDSLIAGVSSPDISPYFKLLTFYISATVVLGLIQILINRASSFMQSILVRDFSASLEIMKAKKLASLDLKTIESPTFKDRYTKIDQESNRAYSLISPLADIPGNIVSLISAIAILVTLSPWVALLVIVSSLPRVFVTSRLTRSRFNLSTELSPLHKAQGWLAYYLLRNRNYMELKILNLVPFLSEKYKHNSDEILAKRTHFDLNREKATLLSFLPLDIVDGAITIWMAYQTLTKVITIGSFQLYFQALHRVQGEFQGLTSSLVSIYENYLYVSELVWFLHLEPKIENDKGTVIPENESLTIEFKNVWFRYRQGQRWTLKNISFTLREGEHVAIVGVNGAGKSTLLKLLARFYDPQKGVILVNGQDIKNFNIHYWRALLAVLFQEFETYPFSAQESIGYGQVEEIKNIDKIKEAAKATDIHDFIDKLPEKYRNPLNPEFEGGVRPSIGQWQRIGIARMLFRKLAKIIVMDEPTSNVDPEAEEKIFDELNKVASNKILIFVTQRFSTVRIADKILLLEGGRITEQGTHDHLMHLKGKYHELFTLQAKGYK